MRKNAIHNFNISIEDSTAIGSSEQLTKDILKELAKVSKEMSQQKDIVQEWDEQKSREAAAILNNSNASTEGGATHTTVGTNQNSFTSISTTSSVSEEAKSDFAASTIRETSNNSISSTSSETMSNDAASTAGRGTANNISSVASGTSSNTAKTTLGRDNKQTISSETSVHQTATAERATISPNLLSTTSSTTKTAQQTLTTPTGGGAVDTTGRITKSSSTSADTTSPGSGAASSIPNLSSGLATPIYGNVAVEQTLIVPQKFQANTGEPTIEVIKAAIKKKLNEATNTKDKVAIKYWTAILKAFNQGAVAKDFDGKKDQEPFTQMYFGLKKWRLATIEETTVVEDVNWGDVSELMVLKLLKLSDDDINEDSKEYFARMIKKIKNPKVNIPQLFSEHDELFVLLKSVFPNLPDKITIQTQKGIYPNLSPQKMYPEIGVENMYFIWAETQLDEVLVKYAKGEIMGGIDGWNPVLKEGQWYFYDRWNDPTKEGTTFWKASIYNTMQGNHYFYHTIAQRHAYYKFVDAYLKTKGIISEWFDAAARVTMGSIGESAQGETALGAAENINLWYLSDETEEFLQGGNQYLFADNMNNVKLLLEGKGKMNGEFTDAKGNKQSFKNLSQQELDFKLVEFEQSLVQEYINFSFGDLNNSFLRKSLDEIPTATGNKEFDTIIEQINASFTHWMAPDIIEDIMEKYFTKNGKLTFNFQKYDDRVKLGQVMVKELYYLKLSDTFKIDNFDKIIENPFRSSRKTKYFRIDQQHAVNERPKHFKEHKIAERLLRIKEHFMEKAVYLLSNSDEVIWTIIDTGIATVDEMVNSIEDISAEVNTELINLYTEISEEFERVKLNDHYSKTYIDLIKNLYDDITEINKIRKKLKEKIEEKIKEKKIKIGKKVKEEIVQLPSEVAGNVLARRAERIYPNVSKLSEREKEALFRTDYEATVAILLYEFGEGVGPENRNFDFHIHKFAQAILKDRMIKEIMEETLKLLRQTNYDFVNKPDSRDLRLGLEFSPSLSPKLIIESLDKHFTSNLAQIFIGGAFALVRIKNGKLEGYIYNETSRESLVLHLSIGDLKREDDGGKERKTSTIIQRIYFTFDLPKM